MSARPQPAAPPAAGLYLHLPFCSAICPYCDFAVKVGSERERAAFVDRLRAEVALHRGLGWSFDTVYLGGGTPSLLAPEALAALLEAVRGTFHLAPETGVFLEANPEDVRPASLAAWRQLGVAFLSLGLQAFDDESLRFLGRRHTAAEGRRAVEQALAAGFATVSIDLIYALPGQTPGGWRRTLEEAVALAPHHLSCYALEIHPRTSFGKLHARGALAPLPDDAQADLFLLTHELLATAGWPAYEVSNFARAPEHRSRHNRKYWDHTPYLGLGPSAHSFDGGRRRWWNERGVAPWGRRLAAGERPIAGEETLTDEQLALEALMLGLRTVEGVDLGAIAERHGIALLPPHHEHLRDLTAAGLVRRQEPTLQLTARGLAVADLIAAELMPAPCGGRMFDEKP